MLYNPRTFPLQSGIMIIMGTIESCCTSKWGEEGGAKTLPERSEATILSLDGLKNLMNQGWKTIKFNWKYRTKWSINH